MLSWGTLFVFSSCQSNSQNDTSTPQARQENEEAFRTTMQKHLGAVANKDLATLKSTLSPDGKMVLILPQTEITNTVDEFMKYHQEWFQDTTWTFETKILTTEIADSLGMAITEIVYREPERYGKPYFNRMIVSYDLKKSGNSWYVIKDHASSVEKSTD
ncbi:hypothetical protein GCM10007390_12350 [Persicitalea jodogahamensis]|uniref:SnoaL-like domain-containing protein n=2 Tax=Persicitalea jodogahamensis TaxID=402147 RepID=A0A8J3D2N7_9BACT|nr:hypothetical protein GCM10007390_12350 [Persicitalea jodogahamensis]